MGHPLAAKNLAEAESAAESVPESVPEQAARIVPAAGRPHRGPSMSMTCACRAD